MHAVDHENMANERDDTVLMTCGPQGREKVIDYYLEHKDILFSKDSHQSQLRPSLRHTG